MKAMLLMSYLVYLSKPSSGFLGYLYMYSSRTDMQFQFSIFKKWFWQLEQEVTASK